MSLSSAPGQPAAIESWTTRGPASLVHHLVLWAAVVVSLWLAWIGFVASDDSFYAITGLGWAHDFPYVARDFATARTVIGIPIALMISLFGEREFTVILSTCLFFLATASLTLSVLSRLVGAVPATVACALMSTIPLFALKSTIPSADQPELFFVASSFWLFWLANRREQRFWLLIAAGVCGALAFSAHEVSAGLLAFYGVLFLMGFGIRRREYWIMAIGFLAVIALECAYYSIFAGDPLHRFRLLVPATGAAVGQGGDRTEAGFLAVAAGGTLHVSDYIDPLLMFFTHHDFGLLGFVAIPALWWACVARRQDRSLILVTARLLAGMAFVWFLFSAIMLRALILLPRYYTVTAYCLFLIVALWACVELWPRRRKLAVAGGTLFLLVNLIFIYLDDKNPRFGERALVEYLGVSSGPVYTDPMTADKVEWFCRWAKVDCARIKAGPPVPNEPFFYNSRNADRPNRLVRAEQVQLYRPGERWKEVWQKEEPHKLTWLLAQKLGLARFLPPGVLAKFDRPNRIAKVFQIPD